MIRLRLAVAVACVVSVVCLTHVSAQQSVTETSNKHNLSAGGPGPVTSSQSEICIFCHTPHNTNPVTPLWSQHLSTATYDPYSSSTMASQQGLPQGSSKLCLSCHDGTVAVGDTAGRGQISMQGLPSGKLTGAPLVGTGLGDDHPISFVPVTGPAIVSPPAGSPVTLDANGQVQCRSCHDPHQMNADPVTGKFLVMNNSGSAMCLVCHQQPHWSSNPSTHMTSTKPFTAAQGAHTGYETVATNGCGSCHKSHTATSGTRTLKGVEEATCGNCHGASAVGRNIQAEFAKLYRHPTYSVTPSAHDAAESPTSASGMLPEVSIAAPRHAECEDCHNPHASYALSADAPKASGKLAGVWGIDRLGSLVLPSGTPPSVNEYEICYKCHGDSANIPQAGGMPSPPYPQRLVPQFNKRLQFDTTAVSFHPVERDLPGAQPAVSISGVSIKAPWTTTSVILCSDCHDNDAGPRAPTPGSGPAGVHGSSYKHILAGRYDMDNEYTNESAAAYALCYKCHDRTRIRSSASWERHDQHIRDKQTSCSICHDPHGVSSGQGTTTNNAHLINLDLRFVTASRRTGRLEFQQTSPGRGRCYLTCHGEDHDPYTY
ncbi:MAG: cytochrome c3 family protein [Vicinamibacterales bacterium]